jgi:hypothetical protein
MKDDRIIMIYDNLFLMPSYIGKETKVYYSEGFYKLKDPCEIDLNITSTTDFVMKKYNDKIIEIENSSYVDDDGYEVPRYRESKPNQKIIEEYYRTIGEK